MLPPFGATRRGAFCLRFRSAAATAAGVRAAAGEVGELRTSVEAQLGQLRATLASVQALAELLERDPGALLHGRAAPRSPLPEARR